MSETNKRYFIGNTRKQLITSFGVLFAFIMTVGLAINMFTGNGDVEDALRQHVQAEIIKDIKRAESLMGAVNRNAPKTSESALKNIEAQVKYWDIKISDTQKKEDGSYVGYASIQGSLTNTDNGVENDVNQNVKFEYVIIDGEDRIQKLDMVK